MFTRRLGIKSVKTLGSCVGGHTCPGILEIVGGDFAVIGTDITAVAESLLPEGSGRSPEERIVRIPRQVLVEARPDIPERT